MMSDTAAHVTVAPRETGRLDALADSHEHCDAALIQLPMIPGCFICRSVEGVSDCVP